MYTYEDLSDLAHAKEDRRGRLVSRIRGWLRKERSPQLTIALLLLPTATFVVGVDWALRRGGFDLTPLRWVFALFAAWPVFALLLRWRASVEWRHLHLDRIGLEYIRYDEGAEASMAAPVAVSKSPEQLRRAENIRRAVRESVCRESGRQFGSGGLPVALFLAALTLGCWTIWKMIQSGPSLLTDAIIDGEAVPSSAWLATRIEREHWFASALFETYMFFVSLAFVAFLLGLTLPFFSSLWEYKPTRPPHSVAFLHFVVSNRSCTV